MAGVICEMFERFDIDGVELDFMRHPTFFNLKSGYANRHLMTDLVRHVKRRMADVSRETGGTASISPSGCLRRCTTRTGWGSTLRPGWLRGWWTW